MTREIRGGRGRKPSKAAARRSLLIFTEGEKTETIYLQHRYRLHRYRLHRDRVIVTFDDFHGQAMNRARALDGKHRGDGSPPRSNPSTDVWRLVERIRAVNG